MCSPDQTAFLKERITGITDACEDGINSQGKNTSLLLNGRKSEWTDTGEEKVDPFHNFPLFVMREILDRDVCPFDLRAKKVCKINMRLAGEALFKSRSLEKV